MTTVDKDSIGWGISTTHDGFKFDWLVEKMKENKELVELFDDFEGKLFGVADLYTQYHYHPKRVPWFKRAFVVEYIKEPILPEWPNLFRVRWEFESEKCIFDSYSTKSYVEGSEALKWTLSNLYKIRMIAAKQAIQENPYPKLMEMHEFIVRNRHLFKGRYNASIMSNVIRKCRDGQNYFVDNIYLTEEEKDLVSMCEQCPFDIDQVKELVDTMRQMGDGYEQLIKDEGLA